LAKTLHRYGSALDRLLTTETGSSIDLDVYASCSLLNSCIWYDVALIFVQNVVVTGSVEEVDHRSIGVCWNTIGIFCLEDMGIGLRTWTPVEVENLRRETNWLQENIDQKGHTQMINLCIRDQHSSLKIFVDSNIWNKALIHRRVAFQARSCEEPKVIYDGVGLLLVVKSIQQYTLRFSRCCFHQICQEFQ